MSIISPVVALADLTTPVGGRYGAVPAMRGGAGRTAGVVRRQCHVCGTAELRHRLSAVGPKACPLTRHSKLPAVTHTSGCFLNRQAQPELQSK